MDGWVNRHEDKQTNKHGGKKPHQTERQRDRYGWSHFGLEEGWVEIGRISRDGVKVEVLGAAGVVYSHCGHPRHPHTPAGRGEGLKMLITSNSSEKRVNLGI